MSINHVRPWRNIYRRKSRQIMVGSVPVGGAMHRLAYRQ